MDSSKESKSRVLSVYLDRIEELEDGTAEAVFLIEDEEDEFREFILPTDFLPEGTDEGEYLTIKISREPETTQAALEEARELLKNLAE